MSTTNSIKVSYALTAASGPISVKGKNSVGNGPSSSLAITVTNEINTIQITEESNQFNCYPNPFTREITIEVHNYKHVEMKVEIYNMAGQLIRSLFKGNNAEHLVLKWNGTNDSGQQVAPGMYLCKVNGQSKHVIFTGIGN
jgi:hypothetical protein